MSPTAGKHGNNKYAVSYPNDKENSKKGVEAG